MTAKVVRELKSIFEREGFKVLDVEKTRNNHLRVTFINRAGREQKFVGPSTPSDFRWMRQVRCDLRKATRQ